MYIYVELNHFAVQQKLTQHCKSTILQLKKKRERHLELSLSLFPSLLCEDIGGRQLFTSREESPYQKPSLPAPWSWPSSLEENTVLLFKPPGPWYLVMVAWADQDSCWEELTGSRMAASHKQPPSCFSVWRIFMMSFLQGALRGLWKYVIFSTIKILTSLNFDNYPE